MVQVKQLLSVSDTLPWGGGVKGLVGQRPFSVVFERHGPTPGGWGWEFLGCWVCELWNSGALKMCI